MKFKNMKEFNRHLEKCVREAMDVVGREAEKELERYVQEKFYDMRDPKAYQRTMQYLKSIYKTKCVVKDGYYKVVVGFDNAAIKTEILSRRGIDYNGSPMGQNWNKHASFDGTDVSDWIAYMMEYGNDKYDGSPNPFFQFEGIESMKHMKEWLSDKLTEILVQELQRKGIAIRKG